MVSEKMKPFMANNSAIRAMFEEGNRMAEQYGRENVYDFSLGNPNVPVPQVNDAILELVKTEDFNTLHGYMSNAGYPDVRQTIADSLKPEVRLPFFRREPDYDRGRGQRLKRNLKEYFEPGRRGDRICSVLCGVRRVCKKLRRKGRGDFSGHGNLSCRSFRSLKRRSRRSDKSGDHQQSQ